MNDGQKGGREGKTYTERKMKERKREKEGREKREKENE